jgi:hypothetical protein
MTHEQKLLIWGITGFFTLSVLAVVGYFVFSAQPQKDVSDTPTEYIVYAPLQIENFSAYPDITPSTQTAIVNSLQQYIDKTNSTTAITGVVRNGSYNKTTDGAISITTFLIDISAVQRTYKVHIGSDTSTGENSLYILCPTDAELQYPPFECKDDLTNGGAL